MELTLTIDQLKNYLGTGLKFKAYYFNTPFDGEMDHFNIYSFINNETKAKLMFYKLSNLDIFISDLGFVPYEKLMEVFGDIESITDTQLLNSWTKWGIAQKLFQWHFWPFGDEYFEAGLVIDKLK